MKNVVGLILSVVLLFSIGCTSRKVDARLAQVNDLANAGETDSAIALLQSIEKTSLNEYNSRYHDLMDIKTRDKADADITGDTAIVDIMEYFDDEGPDEVRGEAYYYGGRVYREMGDAPQALDYYQKAQDAYPQDQAFMKGKIASQMGQLFLELYMFDHAKTKFQEAIHHQKECKDTRGELLNYHSMGESYQWLNKLDSAMCCFNEALKLIDEIKNNKRIKIEIHTAKIDLFIKQKDFDKALQELKHIEPYLHENYISNSTLATAINIYTHKKELDKAESYSNRLVDTGSLYGKKFGYRVLAHIAELQKNSRKSKKYNDLYKDCIDSSNNNASRKAVIHQNSLYNYSLREIENLNLKNRQLLIIIGSLCSIFMLAILVIIVIYTNRMIKRKNKILNEQNQKLQESCDDLETKNKQMLTEQEQLNINLAQQFNKILKLETDIKSLQENLSFNELNEKINLQILSKIQNINTDNYVLDNKILLSDVYYIFKQKSKGEKVRLIEQNWIELDNLVNEVYVDFKRKLFYLYEQLGEVDYQLCLLLKCKFTIKEIAELTNRSSNAITNQRKRLYKKLFGVDGLPNYLDKYIISL